MENDLAQTESWVAESQQGDRRAFECLYLKFHRRLYLFCRRMTGDVSSAEEVLQESFIKAWLALPKFRGESGFYTWLRIIASRVAVDRVRLKDTRIWENTVEYETNEFYTRTSFEEVMDLEKLIALLPKGARSVLVLHDIEGYSHREIAELFDMAEGTSKAQLSRARKLLRARLTNNEGVMPEEKYNGN